MSGAAVASCFRSAEIILPSLIDSGSKQASFSPTPLFYLTYSRGARHCCAGPLSNEATVKGRAPPWGGKKKG